MNILKQPVNSNNILKVFVPLTYFIYALANFLTSDPTAIIRHVWFESWVLIVSAIVLIPTFVQVTSIRGSKDTKVFKKFFKTKYSVFVKFIGVMFIFLPSALLLLLSLGLIAAILSGGFGHVLVDIREVVVGTAPFFVMLTS